MARNALFFGANEPLQIFQDEPFETGRPMTSHAPMPSVNKPPRAPLGSADSNVVFNPPSSSAMTHSPFKGRSSSPRSPLKHSNGTKLKAVTMGPPRRHSSVTDSLEKKPFLSQFKTNSQKAGIDLGMSFGKENVHPAAAPPMFQMSIETFPINPNGKRGLMDAAPIMDARPSKKQRQQEEDTELPPPSSFPPILDDGSKPSHSYAQLIGMAILRSPMRRLTLSQIYKWISDTYSFYGPSDSGWQNSIRHNLSLHKNFIKTERPKDDPGKGNYWTIQPGTEMQFLKEKPTRKNNPGSDNLPGVMSTRLEPAGPTFAPPQEPCLPPPGPNMYAALPQLPTSQATVSMPAEPSSDATIPVSDSAAQEDSAEKSAAQQDGSMNSSLYSPLPAPIHSSPPVSRRRSSHGGTPPSGRAAASSAARPHKRKFASMDDSGYISSLESSAIRPSGRKPNLMTSEADRPRIKRGRAEEEIIRLRGSSPFSPTKARSHPYNPVSSSPLRQSHDRSALPLTPNVIMRPPVRPPPSVSPNTNLRIHRSKVSKMLRSPTRDLSSLIEDTPWSPAFNLDDTSFAFDQALMGNTDFDIFQDLTNMDGDDFASFINTDSPIKRSGPRSHLSRTMSTPALGDVTNLSARKQATTDLLKLPDQRTLAAIETPSKFFEGLSSPAKMLPPSPCRNRAGSRVSGTLELPGDVEWPSMMFDPNEFMSKENGSMTDFAGLDMLQGFQRIGAGQPSGAASRPKPNFERSYSTQF